MQCDDFITSMAGVRVPAIIYGTAWKKERTKTLVEQALAAGFRGIDTACQPKHYYESGVGEALAASYELGLSREQVYLQSKFTPLNGHDPQQIPYDPKASLGEQVAQSFQTSLKNLQTDYLDGLILHSPLADRQELLEVWQAMEAIVKSGHVRQLGISNCYDPALFQFLYESASVKPALVQNRFYADTGYDSALRDYCREHSVIYQSFWTLTANPRVLAARVVKELAIKHKRTPAQVFFRYLTQIGIVPLTGTSSEQHMQEDLAIFVFDLTQEECGLIECVLFESR